MKPLDSTPYPPRSPLRPRRLASAGAAALCAIALSSGALAGQISGSYYKSIGNSNAGGYLSTSGHASTSTSGNTSSASAGFAVTAGLKLLGKSAGKSGVRGDVQASSQRTLVGFTNVGGTYFTPKYSYSGVSSGSLKAFAAGYTVWTQSLANYYSYSKSVSLNLFTPSPSITVWVGPVPVTVKGNVGFGGSLTISGRLLPGQATMNGNAACWANGWASAGIGVSGYSISIVLKLSFGRQDVLLKFDVKCFGEPTASMSYWLNAVALKIKLKLEAWPFEWTKTLASWSSSPYSKVLF